MEKYHNCSILLLCLSLSPLLLSLLSQYAFQLRFRTSFFTVFSPSTFSFYPPSHYFLTHYNPTISLGSSSNGWNGYSLRIVNSPNRRIIIQFIEERLFYSIASFIYFHSWFSTLLSQWTFPFDFLTPCFHSIFSPLPLSLHLFTLSTHHFLHFLTHLSPLSHCTFLSLFYSTFSLHLLLHFPALVEGRPIFFNTILCLNDIPVQVSTIIFVFFILQISW